MAVEQAVAAPLCTARLADAGARVIKIERATGDFARAYDRAGSGDSSYFAWLNHGKESVAIDIKDTADVDLLRAMADSADVFVQNLAPGALDRAGLGLRSLRSSNPRLITCDISGYGHNPAVIDKPAYDLLIQAESGLIAISGGRGEYGRVGISICDIGAGLTAHAAILEALIARSVSGEGAALSVSLFDVAAEWMTVPLVHQEYGSGGPVREGLRHPSIAPYGGFTSSDEHTTIISIQNEREWDRFCTGVLDRPALKADPRFAGNDRRVANRNELEEELGRLIGAMSAAQLRGRLTEFSIAYGEVNSLDQLGVHPALRRRLIETTNHSTMSVPASPVRWGGESRDPSTPVVPSLDADGDRIRAEFSGEAGPT